MGAQLWASAWLGARSQTARRPPVDCPQRRPYRPPTGGQRPAPPPPYHPQRETCFFHSVPFAKLWVSGAPASLCFWRSLGCPLVEREHARSNEGGCGEPCFTDRPA